MDEHPSLEVLCEFVEARLPREEAHQVVAHFLGCRSCGEEAARYNLLRLSRESRAESASGGDGVVMDRALNTLQYGASLSRPEPEEIQARSDIAKGPIGAALIDSLLGLSWSLRFQNPAEMIDLARSAVMVSLEMRPETFDLRQLSDLRCRAWAHLGNSYRVAGELMPAAEALARAAEFLEQGSGDPALKARIFEFQGSLLSNQQDHEPAQAALDAAFAIYVGHGELHAAGRVLISKAVHGGGTHRPHEAARLTAQGLALLDETADPELFFIAAHNQLWFLVECGCFAEARELLRNRRPLQAADRLNELTLQWLEGRIAGGLGELPLAAEHLSAVQHGFEDAGLRYRAALVALDLAAVLFHLGQAQEACETVSAAVTVFAEQKVPNSSLAANPVLRTALEIETTPLLLATQIAELLHQTGLGRGER